MSVPLAAVTGSLPMGGSSTFLVNLSAAFVTRGFQLPIVILSGENDHRHDLEAHGASAIELPGSDLIYEDGIALAYNRLSIIRPKAVLASLASGSFEVLRLVPPGVVRMGIVHSDDPVVYEMVRRYAPWIDVMVGVSRTICDRLRKFSEFKTTRTEYIPYGIHFEEIPPIFHGEIRPLRVIYLGRLIEEQKRISRIIEVVRRTAPLSGSLPWVEFTIAGAGPQRDEVLNAISGLPHVRYRGELPNCEVQRVLSSQDVYLLLSDFEGLPLSLLEAMGNGLVPVVSDLESGLREIVSESCGLRVATGDVSAAVAALQALAADRTTLRVLSNAARSAARANYSASVMADRYLALIDSMMPDTPVFWPASGAVPTPLGVASPMYFHPAVRPLRRCAKRLGFAH